MWLKIALGAKILALNHGQLPDEKCNFRPDMIRVVESRLKDKHRALWCTPLIPA
jgi:hypothetical protein